MYNLFSFKHSWFYAMSLWFKTYMGKSFYLGSIWFIWRLKFQCFQTRWIAKLAKEIECVCYSMNTFWERINFWNKGRKVWKERENIEKENRRRKSKFRKIVCLYIHIYQHIKCFSRDLIFEFWWARLFSWFLWPLCN